MPNILRTESLSVWGQGMSRPGSRRTIVALLGLAVTVVVVSDARPARAERGSTVRVSVSWLGMQADQRSTYPSMSTDGRTVAFASTAPNLVPADSNGASDVFVNDRVTGSTSRVSIGTGGTQADSYSAFPFLSADGRYVAFQSAATNLVAGDTNGADDLFVHDRALDVTTRVSVASNGAQANNQSGGRISATGRFLAIASAATNLVPGEACGNDVYLHDRDPDGNGVLDEPGDGRTSTVLVSVGLDGHCTGQSNSPSVSSDGNLVVFASFASNLVPGDTNGNTDVFVRDMAARTTTRVSVDSSGAQGSGEQPTIAADGRVVAFLSASPLGGVPASGRDIFVHDLVTRQTMDISFSTAGNHANDSTASASLSADGRFVAFHSPATNLVPGDTNAATDVFVRDTTLGTTTRVSVDSGGGEADDASLNASISGDGRSVAFDSRATNLVAGDTNGTWDVFLHEPATPSVIEPGLPIPERGSSVALASVSSAGEQASENSTSPQISADGRKVVFVSIASMLVPGDTNNEADVFLRNLENGTTIRVSVGDAGQALGGASYSPSVSADGRYVAFVSRAKNLITGDVGDANAWPGVFVRDLQSGKTTRVSVGPERLIANGQSFAPSISADGRVVAFHSLATNLDGPANSPAGPCGIPDRTQVFVVRNWDAAPSVECASVDTNGVEGNRSSERAVLSGDGNHVAFESEATNLVSGDNNGKIDVFLRDLTRHTTKGVSVAGAQTGAGSSSSGAISFDGGFVAFESTAQDLTPGLKLSELNVFVRDTVHDRTIQASVGPGGIQPNGDCTSPTISADGTVVAFVSTAANLAAGAFGQQHVYASNAAGGQTVLVSTGSSGPGNDRSLSPAVSGDGRRVAFASDATNLVVGDTNEARDIFVWDGGSA